MLTTLLAYLDCENSSAIVRMMLTVLSIDCRSMQKKISLGTLGDYRARLLTDWEYCHPIDP